MMPNCMHTCCASCTDTWIKSTSQEPKCPVCRHRYLEVVTRHLPNFELLEKSLNKEVEAKPGQVSADDAENSLMELGNNWNSFKIPSLRKEQY